MRLEEIFNEVSKTMLSDLDRARTAIGTHPGLKGTAFEDIVRKFLRDYLPSSLDIISGIIIDSDGNGSKQLDIIITDAAKTPIFYRSENVRVVPIECVYAVVEVKAKLTADELDKALENMRSVKSLKKKAFLIEDSPLEYKVKMYGQKFDIWPVNYYIFAFDSIDLLHIAQSLTDVYNAAKTPLQDRIDTICVLDKGVIANGIGDGGLNVNPEPGTKITVANTRKALVVFYGLICTNLLHAQLPTIHLNPYIGKIQLQ